MRRFSPLFCCVGLCFSACSLAWEPTPDPTQGLSAAPILEETREINGAVTTNLALEQTQGLGLSLEEVSGPEIPTTVEERVASLNPSIEITSPLWGEVVTPGTRVEVVVSGASSLRQLYLYNGQVITGGRNSFVLPAIFGADFSLLQAFLLSEEKQVVDFWNVAFRHQEAQELPISLETPLLTIIEPQSEVRYQGQVPIVVHLSKTLIGPGGARLAIDVDGEVTYVSHTQPFLLALTPGRYVLRIFIVDHEKQVLVRPLFQEEVVVFVD